MIYDKTIFIENIYYLINQKNIRIGELENKCGLSIGYFSRLKNDENNKAGPSIDSLLKLSNLLKVDLTLLTTTRINQMSTDEQLICDFLQYIIDETNNENIIWEKYDYNDTTYIDFPEFNMNFDNKILSLFTKRQLLFQNYYVADISGKKFLYVDLYSIEPISMNEDRAVFEERDLYILGEKISKFSYGTNNNEVFIDHLMELLGSCIYNSPCRNRLTDDIAEFVKSILNRKLRK